MKINLKILIPLSLMSASAVLAADNNDQTSGVVTYKINKHTILSGGGVITSSNGVYKVTSSIGQIDAGVSTSSNGVYKLNGGFLTGQASVLGDSIFKNGFE